MFSQIMSSLIALQTPSAPCAGFDIAGNLNGQKGACPHTVGTCLEDVPGSGFCFERRKDQWISRDMDMTIGMDVLGEKSGKEGL